MSVDRECAVTSCPGSGKHEIDDEYVLCLGHAMAWDEAEDERLGRLTELHVATPDAPEEDVWGAYVSEWLGAQS